MSNNELIAEFMDEAFIREKNWHRMHWKDMPFDKSWDWLMPVVEKISKTKPMNQAWYDVKYHLIDARMPVVYIRVVEFIKWFNQQKGNESL